LATQITHASLAMEGSIPSWTLREIKKQASLDEIFNSFRGNSAELFTKLPIY